MSALKSFSASHRGGDGAQDTLRAALIVTAEFARACALDPAMSARLAIVVEELVENVLTHGADSADVMIRMQLDRAGDAVVVVLEDTGIAFDPRSAPDPPAPRADRGGGVGLALVRAWSEIRSYQCDAGVNRLELALRAPEASVPDS
ncbi:MAG: ATP-binding protein [Novosphingobium sp.]